ncbi:uncharacterized protein BDCG_04669 [Blastomyces dermatitidis ER-3]|uniref:Uncharacterized protein n=1 Tax=Ajellomyces dermatitidis (strain ER-3 / ATCC MYA-2586) TaxID=559297 RepID=A0ABM9YHS3_AJEDR|nr:uncharacterized protein BDCG_04669 [Blastomyces dermatitidis ER-3]EEQ89549.2 hypothetical protein BDCG_04669 [Blastomyces dermatitidis ER-3]
MKASAESQVSQSFIIDSYSRCDRSINTTFNYSTGYSLDGTFFFLEHCTNIFDTDSSPFLERLLLFIRDIPFSLNLLEKQSHLNMSDTSVTSEFSSRPRITHFTRQLIDRMITHYEKAPDLQDETEISFHQSMKFDDETTEKLQNKEKQSQYSSAESVHFNCSNPSPFLILRMSTFNDDLNQSIYCITGNLMNLIQMMLQNQMAAAEITQHLTTSVSAQRDTMRDEL